MAALDPAMITSNLTEEIVLHLFVYPRGEASHTIPTLQTEGGSLSLSTTGTTNGPSKVVHVECGSDHTGVKRAHLEP